MRVNSRDLSSSLMFSLFLKVLTAGSSGLERVRHVQIACKFGTMVQMQHQFSTSRLHFVLRKCFSWD